MTVASDLSTVGAENAHHMGIQCGASRDSVHKTTPTCGGLCDSSARRTAPGLACSTEAIIGLVERDAVVLFGPVTRCWSFLPWLAYCAIALGSASHARHDGAPIGRGRRHLCTDGSRGRVGPPSNALATSPPTARCTSVGRGGPRVSGFVLHPIPGQPVRFSFPRPGPPW